jgi:IS30 family transposase
VLLLHLPAGRDARLVEQAMRQAITALPGELARTITLGSGKEMAYHADFTIATGIPVYFCDPTSPGSADPTRTPTGAAPVPA